MEQANRHYYAHHQPFGSKGDFITAPDISHLFGEMVAVWLIERWQDLGEPSRVYLLEAGPGRGTLMADILRTSQVSPAFAAALSVHLLENSPQLSICQQQTLAPHGSVPQQWHGDLHTVPTDAPLLFVANEFLDALPVEQAIWQHGGWQQRLIQARHGGTLSYTYRPLSEPLPLLPASAPEGSIYEYAPLRLAYAAQLHERLRTQGGAGLWIDYGDYTPATHRLGDTLQALRHHHPASPLENAGEADLTAHVDFFALAHQAETFGLTCHFCLQRDFLFACGMQERLTAVLKKTIDPNARHTLLNGYQRLVGLDQMGVLFKILAIAAEKDT